MKTMLYKTHYASPIGDIALESDGEALIGLRFEFQDPELSQDEGGEELPVFKETRKWLDQFFGGQAPDFIPPLRLEGTPFQKTVWNFLLTIPFGETTTYGKIAAWIARQRGIWKMSAQAVGGAVSKNPVALIVPCHRVVGADGDLIGYAGGIDRKEWLLTHERPRCK